MSTAHPDARSHNPLIVCVAIITVALPATILTALVDLTFRFSEGAVGFALWCPLAIVPAVCGLIAYVVGLRLDPNVPRLALLPAVVTTIITSVIASFAAVVWLIATAS